MKIIISTAGDRVAEHFGRCRKYTIRKRVYADQVMVKNRLPQRLKQ